MKLYFFSFFRIFVWSIALLALVQARPRRVPRMVGGQLSQSQEWPFIASLHRQLYPWSTPKFFCGGVVWSENTILTAAHCLRTSLDPREIRVYVGQSNITNIDTDYLYKVDKFIRHPDYIYSQVSNDLALVRLTENINFTASHIRPVHHPVPQSQLNTSNCVAMGFGDIGDWSFEFTKQLNQVALKPMSRAKCLKQFDLKNIEKLLPSDVVCASDEQGTRGACSGDSGSPMVCALKSDPSKFALFGIASRADNWCELALISKPSIYIPVERHQQWIKDTLASNVYDSDMSNPMAQLMIMFLKKLNDHV